MRKLELSEDGQRLLLGGVTDRALRERRDAQNQGFREAAKFLGGLGGERRDWTDEIRSHREVQNGDRAIGNWVSWRYHEGVIACLVLHSTRHCGVCGQPLIVQAETGFCQEHQQS